jgi:hypothetical protein
MLQPDKQLTMCMLLCGLLMQLLLHVCSGGGIGLLVVGNLRITSTADVCPVLPLLLLL